MGLETLSGSTLDQKYRVGRQLGVGAMGAVFQATHLGTTRPVALKVIVPQLAENQEFAQRFKREAEAAGQLIHPNVVNVTDFGVTRVEGRDLAYLVMEYLDGHSLADYLKLNGRPMFNFVLDVMDQAGLALDAAYAAGIVHRDLKPSNIWLQPNHRGGYNIKVLDFGIAKVANPAEKQRALAADAIATLMMSPSATVAIMAFDLSGAANPLATPSHLQTTAGTLLGTPSYMAPEQCAGFEVDARTDVYSLAVIAYQMLCGRLPFEAENLAQLIQQQIQTTPKSPREQDDTVPEPLAAVVLSGLEKDPSRRPPTAGTFAARLRAGSEAELSLIRQAKDVFHTHVSVFMPVLLACLSVIPVAAIPLQMAAAWASHAKLATDGALLALMSCCLPLCVMFALQLYKAACQLLLHHASEKGQFHSARGPALRALIAGSGALLSTHLLSLIDLRPSSWRNNSLWPVVWAAEGLTGKEAIARSRQLCNTLPQASASLELRQYSLALTGPLVGPAITGIADPGGLHFFVKEILSGSLFGWSMLLTYPVLLGFMFLNFGPAFSFLYWTARRWRNEGGETPLPAATRDDSRKSAGRSIRPALLIWAGLPLVMAAMAALNIVRWQASSAAEAAMKVMDDVSTDGRRTALLKLIDSGLGVDHPISNHETPLFDAVRKGDETLLAELLKRGAKVDARSAVEYTPLMLAAADRRNDIARRLLDHGASVDAATHEGRTPLILAAMQGNVELVQLLLQRGANPGFKDAKGKSAANYASDEGYRELALLLSPGIRKP